MTGLQAERKGRGQGGPPRLGCLLPPLNPLLPARQPTHPSRPPPPASRSRPGGRPPPPPSGAAARAGCGSFPPRTTAAPAVQRGRQVGGEGGAAGCAGGDKNRARAAAGTAGVHAAGRGRHAASTLKEERQPALRYLRQRAVEGEQLLRLGQRRGGGLLAEHVLACRRVWGAKGKGARQRGTGPPPCLPACPSAINLTNTVAHLLAGLPG